MYNVIRSVVKTSISIIDRRLNSANIDFKTFFEIDEYEFNNCKDIGYRIKIDYRNEELIQMGCSRLVSEYWTILGNTKTSKKQL